MAAASESPDVPSQTPFDPASATIVVVTYNRSALLTRLLTSVASMDPAPGHLVVIDNASTDDTTEVVEQFRPRLNTQVVYRRLETNTGGSGGFSEGMRTAYELGSSWIWLMDDDVEVLPDGLARMGNGRRGSRASRAGATTTTAASSTGSTASQTAWASPFPSPPPASTPPGSRR